MASSHSRWLLRQVLSGCWVAEGGGLLLLMTPQPCCRRSLPADGTAARCLPRCCCCAACAGKQRQGRHRAAGQLERSSMDTAAAGTASQAVGLGRQAGRQLAAACPCCAMAGRRHCVLLVPCPAHHQSGSPVSAGGWVPDSCAGTAPPPPPSPPPPAARLPPRQPGCVCPPAAPRPLIPPAQEHG